MSDAEKVDVLVRALRDIIVSHELGCDNTSAMIAYRAIVKIGIREIPPCIEVR